MLMAVALGTRARAHYACACAISYAAAIFICCCVLPRRAGAPALRSSRGCAVCNYFVFFCGVVDGFSCSGWAGGPSKGSVACFSSCCWIARMFARVSSASFIWRSLFVLRLRSSAVGVGTIFSTWAISSRVCSIARI